IGCQLRRGADDDAVEAADDLRQVRVAVDVDLEAAAEELDARVGDGLTDQDAGAAHTLAPSAYTSRALVTATPRSMWAPRSARPSSTAPSAVAMSKTS